MLNNLPQSISIAWLHLTNNFKLELLCRMEQEPNTPTAESPTQYKTEEYSIYKDATYLQCSPEINWRLFKKAGSAALPTYLPTGRKRIVSLHHSSNTEKEEEESPLEIDYLITLCSVNPCFPGPITFRRASQSWFRNWPNNNHYSRICILLVFTLAVDCWKAGAKNQTVLLSPEKLNLLVLFTCKLKGRFVFFFISC